MFALAGMQGRRRRVGRNRGFFFDACDDLGQWTVTGSWTTSRGKCSAKNTDEERFMTTSEYINLLGKQDATLTYSYSLEGADAGEFMKVFISDDGGESFEPVQEIFVRRWHCIG